MSGLVNTCAELLKGGTEKLYRSNVINQCLNGYPVPDNGKWHISSQYTKKEDKKDSSNYRGISASNTMSRLYERILSDLIEKEYSNLEEEEQSEFKARKSCNNM